jgi:stage III sporulation protein AB
MQLKLEANYDVQSAWEESLSYERDSGGAVCALKDGELLIMDEFIAQLGRSDRENQLANIEMAVERLGALYEEALEEQQKKGRMYRSVGLLSALAIIVLCW